MTEPNLKILNRAQAKVDAQKLIDAVSPLLRELVDYSTQTYMRCMHAGDTTFEDLPAFVLYLHIMEMTDGIQVMISNSCCEPVVPLTRSSFEAFISLRYLFQDDYRRRSLSWLYCDFMERKRVEKLLDVESEQGKELHRIVSKELRDVKIPTPSAELLEYIRSPIKDPRFAPIAAEYERLRRKEKVKRPPWYRLFKGPSDIQQLSRKVQMEDFYVVEYRQWSCVLHGGNSRRYLEILSNGTVVGHQLRLAENLVLYSYLAGMFLWMATDSMLMKFRPFERNHAKWSAEIKKKLLELSEIEVEVIERPIPPR
jgi:hypothetical protein